jgi:hypothetical protein
MADHRRSGMIWRAAGYFITAVTIAGWVAVLAYWLYEHGWIPDTWISTLREVLMAHLPQRGRP